MNNLVVPEMFNSLIPYAVGFDKVFDLFVEKFARCRWNVDLNEFAMFDLFDGANHLETVEGKVDLVSFLSAIVNNKLLTLYII